MRRILLLALLALAAGAVGTWWLSSSRDDGDGDRIARRRPPEEAAEPRLVGREPPPAAEPSEGVASLPKEAGAPVRPPAATPFDAEFVDADTGRTLDVQGNVVLGTRPDATVERVTLGMPNPPARWLAWDSLTWGVTASVRTKRLHAVVPLRRELPVTVRLVAPKTHPHGPFQVLWQIAGRSGPVLRTTDTDLSLEGIPSLPGVELRVFAAVDASPPLPAPAEMDLPEVAEIVTEEVEETHTELRAPPGVYASERRVLPYGPARALAITLRVPEPPEGSISWSSHVETDNDLPYQESYGEGGLVPLGSLRVHVLTRDGREAPAGVLVRGPGGDRPTDARGEVLYADVPVGDTWVSLQAAGFVPIRREATIRSGQETRVDLVEPEGATVRVEVVDVEGHGCPFAEVEVLQMFGVPWLDLSDDGVHRVDPFTDIEGRRTLRRVAPGRLRVTGVWAGRNAWTEVDVLDGRTMDVRIVVAAPKEDASQGR